MIEPKGKSHCMSDQCELECYSKDFCECRCDRCGPWNDWKASIQGLHVAVGPEVINEILERDFPSMKPYPVKISNLSLNELRDWAHAVSANHGFHDPAPTVGESVALMHSELSELLEDHRKGRKPNEVFYTKKIFYGPCEKSEYDYPLEKVEVECIKEDPLAKTCGIPSELADCIIRCLDFAGQHDIDIESVLIEKMRYNEKREYRHGGKKL